MPIKKTIQTTRDKILNSDIYDLTAFVDDIKKDQRVVVIDDLIATGGTLKASRSIFEQGGAKVVEFLGVVGLPFLKYKEVLEPTPVRTIIEYDSE